MTLDPVSIALGFVGAYVFSCVAFIALCVVESREGKKRQGLRSTRRLPTWRSRLLNSQRM